MSKQHKLVWNGKNYVTKIGINGCEGCVFFRGHFYVDKCDLGYVKTVCLASNNEDRKGRIWVEDVPVQKKPVQKKPVQKKPDHVWIVEVLEKDGTWYKTGAYERRKTARAHREMRAFRKTRVRKFVAV